MLVRCAVQQFCTGAVPGVGPWAARPLRLAPSGSLRPRPQPRESALWLVFTGYRRGSPAPPLRVAGCGTRGRLWPTSRADALRGPPCCEWVPLAGSRGCLTGADASLRALLRAGSACGGRPHGRRRFAVRPAASWFVFEAASSDGPPFRLGTGLCNSPIVRGRRRRTIRQDASPAVQCRYSFRLLLCSSV